MMKRIFLVLLVATLLGACGESSTDVVTRRGGRPGGGEFIPPDTLIKTDHAIFQVYKPGNIVALESVLSLTSRAPFHDAIETAGSFGYGFDPADVAVATGRLDDGRDVLLALGSLPGLRRSGHVLYIRVGTRELALPLRVTGEGADGYDVLEATGKESIGPQRMWWDWGNWVECLLQAVADIMACRSECLDCYRQCVFMAVLRLTWCIQFVMF